MNYKTIFNHDVSRWVPGDGPPNYLYSGRVLGITEPDDIVQLPPELQPLWKTITAHYKRISLTHSCNPVWDLSWTKLTESRNREISVFLFDDVVNIDSDAADWFSKKDSKWVNCVRYINSKNNFIRLAEKLGVAVPSTICGGCKSQMDLGTLTFPCFLKPAIAGNGAGIIYCTTAGELEQALSLFPMKTPLQIQQEVKTRVFINLQYRVKDNRVQRLAATEQILEGCVYCGSRYPSSFNPWELVDPLAEWMAARGMKDIFAFDVAVSTNPGEPRYLALECNPRFNGASYPTLVAQKLDIENWSYETISTSFRSLDEIDLDGLEFNAQKGSGIILQNWGTILIGKLGILLAGTEEEQKQLRVQLSERLVDKYNS
jgi:hypothetical protein